MQKYFLLSHIKADLREIGFSAAALQNKSIEHELRLYCQTFELVLFSFSQVALYCYYLDMAPPEPPPWSMKTALCFNGASFLAVSVADAPSADGRLGPRDQ